MEQFTNDASSVLDGGIDATQTTLDVIDASKFPTTGDFRIRIEDEILKVTGVASETFTVVRGQEGTTGAAHSDGDDVDHIVTAVSLLSILDIKMGSLASRPASAGRTGRLYIPDDSIIQQYDDGTDWHNIVLGKKWKKPPLVSTFTWLNQGGATATDVLTGIDMAAPASGGENVRSLAKTISGNYTVEAGFFFEPPANSNFYSAGVFCHETSSGKIHSCGVLQDGADVQASNDPFTNATTYAGGSTRRRHCHAPAYFFRLVNNGTNRLWYYSGNGVYWSLFHSTTATDFMTENRVGIYVNTNNGSVAVSAHFFHFDLF